MSHLANRRSTRACIIFVYTQITDVASHWDLLHLHAFQIWRPSLLSRRPQIGWKSLGTWIWWFVTLDLPEDPNSKMWDDLGCKPGPWTCVPLQNDTYLKLFLLFLIASLDFVASPGVFNEFEGSYICLMCIYLYNLYMSQYFDFAWLFGMVKLVFGTFRNITWTLQGYSMLDFS